MGFCIRWAGVGGGSLRQEARSNPSSAPPSDVLCLPSHPLRRVVGEPRTEKGRTDGIDNTEYCSGSAAGDSEAEKKHRQPYCRNLVHGEICSSAAATQADMEDYLRRVQSRLGVS